MRERLGVGGGVGGGGRAAPLFRAQGGEGPVGVNQNLSPETRCPCRSSELAQSPGGWVGGSEGWPKDAFP